MEGKWRNFDVTRYGDKFAPCWLNESTIQREAILKDELHHYFSTGFHWVIMLCHLYSHRSQSQAGQRFYIFSLRYHSHWQQISIRLPEVRYATCSDWKGTNVLLNYSGRSFFPRGPHWLTDEGWTLRGGKSSLAFKDHINWLLKGEKISEHIRS